MQKELKQLVIRGTITNTSKKQSEQYETQNPRKSIYLSLDDKNTKKAIDFGLTQYTSLDKEDFFIVKASEDIKVYKDSEVTEVLDGTDNPESNNFQSKGVVGLALIKGQSRGNDFIRLYAIDGEIEEIKASNPFASDELDNDDLPF